MEEILASAKKAMMEPLEYMLAVMNDEQQDLNRRDRMAVAAAPYCHPKADAVAETKKQRRQANAEAASASGKYAVPSAPKLIIDNERQH